MRHLDMLSARFGAEHVLGGASRIVADLDPEGRVLHIEQWQDLVFGELDKRVTPRIEAIAKTLHGAGFEDQLSPDIIAFMWQKWMLLASMAGLTCLLRGVFRRRNPTGLHSRVCRNRQRQRLPALGQILHRRHCSPHRSA
jgi:2-dehydropantoate 2-reductase